MKLSELTTSQAADVLCEITPRLSSIAGDADLVAVLKNKIPKGSTTAEVYLHGSKVIVQLVPIILKTHRDDVFGVLSALNGVTVEEISKQNIMVTMRQISDLVQDKEMQDFFKSLQPEGATE